jgi:hypothetical protein
MNIVLYLIILIGKKKIILFNIGDLLIEQG